MEDQLNGKNNVDRLDFGRDLCYTYIYDTDIYVMDVE